jgi:hypothetical protein
MRQRGTAGTQADDAARGQKLVEVQGWLAQQVSNIRSNGRDESPWLALANDDRMAELWKLVADWPPNDTKSLIGFAGCLAESGVPRALADPPSNRVGLAWAQYCISDSAIRLAIDLQCYPDTAKELLDEPPGELVERLRALWKRASREAELIGTMAKQLSPGVAVQVSHDRGALAYREALANVIAGLRREGLAVTLNKQDRLVALLTNIVVDRTVTPESEERRRQRNRQIADKQNTK